MNRFSSQILLSLLCACQLGNLIASENAFAKSSDSKKVSETGSKSRSKTSLLDAPGTTDGVKIKMQPQFQEVNDKFRQIYAETRTRTIKKNQPIVVAINDFLVLIDGDRRESVAVISEKYTLLKSVDHIVLATFVALELDTDQNLSAEKLSQLDSLKSLSQKALDSLKDSGLKGEILDRQKHLIDMSLALMTSAIKNKRVSSQELTSFCRESTKMVLQNVDEAVADQLLSVDRQMKKWHAELSAQKWNELNVVVVSGHMPREQNSDMQYFSKMLKEKREGQRIYYCEGMSEENDAVNLVGTHILDKSIAIAFFRDPWRMHRDLLSDGAAKYLSKHSPLK